MSNDIGGFSQRNVGESDKVEKKPLSKSVKTADKDGKISKASEKPISSISSAFSVVSHGKSILEEEFKLIDTKEASESSSTLKDSKKLDSSIQKAETIKTSKLSSSQKMKEKLDASITLAQHAEAQLHQTLVLAKQVSIDSKFKPEDLKAPESEKVIGEAASEAQETDEKPIFIIAAEEVEVETDKTNAEINKLNAAKNQASSKLAKMQKKVDLLKEKETDCKYDLENIEREIDNMNSNIKDYQSDVENLEENAREIKLDLEKNEKTLEILEGDIKNLENEFAELKSKPDRNEWMEDRLETRIDDKKDAKQHAKEDIIENKNDLKENEMKTSAIRKRMDEATSKLHKLMDKAEVIELETDKLNVEMEAAKNEFNPLKINIHNLKIKIENRESHIKRLTDMLAPLQVIEEHKNIISKTIEKLNSLDNLHEEIESDIINCEEQIAAGSHDLEEFELNLNSIGDEIKGIENNNESLKDKIEDLYTALDSEFVPEAQQDIRSKITVLEEDIEANGKQITALQDEQEKIESEIQPCNDFIAEHKDKKEEFINEIREIEYQIDDAIKLFKESEESIDNIIRNNPDLTVPLQSESFEEEQSPIDHSKASEILQKIMSGNISELTFNELKRVPGELNSFADRSTSIEIDFRSLADCVIVYVKSHLKEIEDNPTIGTTAHHILHDFAQREIAKGNIENAFAIEAIAVTEIPLSSTHPLYNLDQAILQGMAQQPNKNYGAYFSSLDDSVVKGGCLHASQRQIDGVLTNSFDFKISHYARDELSKYLQAISRNPDTFENALPDGLCEAIEINRHTPQQYNKYDKDKDEFTKNGGYNPGNALATEVVFKGLGKIIIGESRKVGCMYNWVQFEMEPNLPPGEGLNKLNQVLGVMGLGPVLGQQTAETDERMKIAQLCRAFYPSTCTMLDTTKEFYQMTIEELKEKIIEYEPEMASIFTKYLETSPDLMEKVEIFPGKEIWGVSDLGAEMKANGAWGLMSGVGEKEWDKAKGAFERILLQDMSLSSEQRFQAGLFIEGASSDEDLGCGGGDQVFTRLLNDKLRDKHIESFSFSGHGQILWNLDSVAKRVPYAYSSDSYGAKNRFENRYGEYQKRSGLTDFSKTADGSLNEVMVKNELDNRHVSGFVVNSHDHKRDLINHFIDKGLAEKDATGEVFIKLRGNNIKFDDFVHVASKNSSFKKSWWG